jgi:predicted AAA+ superfamily ATPase
MIDRHLLHLINRFHPFDDKMAFVAGPRQVGKTTLCRMLAHSRESDDLYFNWDDPEFRASVIRSPFTSVDAFRRKTKGRPLAVYDEIHKYPRWKQYLKGLYDTRKDRIDIVVTGSGRLDFYQRGGDSLLGRYLQYRMHPFSVRELSRPPYAKSIYDPADTMSELMNCDASDAGANQALDSLLRWGGFPGPQVKKNERLWRLWIKDRKRLLVREDIRDLTTAHHISHIETLMTLLPERIGSPLSLNALAGDIGVSQPTIGNWIGYFERLYYLYRVPPYSKKLARAIRKDRKVYLWDWSELENEGTRFENLIASHLLKWCDFTENFGFPPLALHFVRDKDKREVDFLVTLEGKPWLLVEVKLSETSPGPSLNYFGDRLNIKHRVLVVEKRLPKNGFAAGIRVMDAASFCASLPV